MNTGIVHLTTKKRNIQVFAGSSETFELFHQVHERYTPTSPTTTTPTTTTTTTTTATDTSANSNDNYNNNDQTNNNNIVKTTTITDYAINWKLAAPAALRDEFITVKDLSQTTNIQGNLNIFVYIQPTNILYNTIPTQPAGVYTYEVNMIRIDNSLNRMREGYKAVPLLDSTVSNNLKVSSLSTTAGMNRKSTTIIIPLDKSISEFSEEERMSNPVYPFLWRDRGPVDSLEKHFGY